jgi:hypothetical protein
MTEASLDEFYENQPKPWWFKHCVHPGHAYWYDPDGNEYGCFKTVKETEQVVVLDMTCCRQIHLCVQLEGGGTACKTIDPTIYDNLHPREEMAMIQDLLSTLKALRPQQLRE